MRTLRLAAALLLSACAPAAQQPAVAAPGAASAGTAAERVVQTQVEAYNRRDIEAFLATYAPDVRIYNHPDQLLGSGLEEMRRIYGAFFAAAPDLQARVTSRMVQGNFVIDHEHVTGMPDGSEIHAVAIYEVRGGRIQNAWFIR